MAVRKVKDLVATIGKYTDREGNERRQYLTVGATFERDDGSRFHRWYGTPAGNQWDGTFAEYDPKPRQEQAPQQAQPLGADPTVPF